MVASVISRLPSSPRSYVAGRIENSQYINVGERVPFHHLPYTECKVPRDGWPRDGFLSEVPSSFIHQLLPLQSRGSSPLVRGWAGSSVTLRLWFEGPPVANKDSRSVEITLTWKLPPHERFFWNLFSQPNSTRLKPLSFVCTVLWLQRPSCPQPRPLDSQHHLYDGEEKDRNSMLQLKKLEHHRKLLAHCHWNSEW